MEIETAALLFQALAQETRLKVFRLLIEAGKPGVAAGEIARALAVPASTLSSHLGILERAGLIQSWRVRRSIYYALAEEGVRGVINFLTQDCCRGRPELCGFEARSKKKFSKNIKQSA